MSSFNVTNSTVEQKSARIEGGQLAYEVGGNGPFMLCIPGMGDTRRVYEYFAPAMRKAGYRVITADLRGNGLSRGKFKTHNLDDLTQDIGAILDAEGVQQAYIVAGSISGASAGGFAVDHPERVLGLVLFGPVMYTGNRLIMAMLAATLRLPGIGVNIWSSYFKTLYPKQPIEADYLAQVKANLQQTGGIKALADMCRTHHLDNKTAKIKVPTLIFFGTKDPDFKDTTVEAQRIQQAIPQARIEVLDGYGHYPQREAATTVIATTVNWLAATQVSDKQPLQTN